MIKELVVSAARIRTYPKPETHQCWYFTRMALFAILCRAGATAARRLRFSIKLYLCRNCFCLWPYWWRHLSTCRGELKNGKHLYLVSEKQYNSASASNAMSEYKYNFEENVQKYTEFHSWIVAMWTQRKVIGRPRNSIGTILVCAV